jgi:hypothetical protein
VTRSDRATNGDLVGLILLALVALSSQITLMTGILDWTGPPAIALSVVNISTIGIVAVRLLIELFRHRQEASEN